MGRRKTYSYDVNDSFDRVFEKLAKKSGYLPQDIGIRGVKTVLGYKGHATKKRMRHK